MQLVQKQRHCQIRSQPEGKKSSRKLGRVAQECPKSLQKRGSGEGAWLKQGTKEDGENCSKAARDK